MPAHNKSGFIVLSISIKEKNVVPQENILLYC